MVIYLFWNVPVSSCVLGQCCFDLEYGWRIEVKYFVWCYRVFVFSWYGGMYKIHILFYRLLVNCICVVVCSIVIIFILVSLFRMSVTGCLQCKTMKSMLWLLSKLWCMQLEMFFFMPILFLNVDVTSSCLECSPLQCAVQCCSCLYLIWLETVLYLLIQWCAGLFLIVAL